MASGTSTPVTPDLNTLFSRAVYSVLDPQHGRLQTRIGQPHAGLAELLARHGARSACLLSACNPQGRALPGADNAERDAALRRALDQQDRVWLPAEGAAENRSWVEPSVLILDIAPSAIQHWAQAFDQAAWVEYDAQGCGRLRWAARRA